MSSVRQSLPIEALQGHVPAHRALRPVADAPDARRRDIQGLRAIAVLMVVAFHAGLPVPGGFLGVDVFFAISGFVITQLLVRELDQTGRLTLPAFYVRRIKRLLPALALMLVVILSLTPLLAPIVTGRTTALTGAAASVFAANAYLVTLGTGYFDADTSLNPLLHTWTLAVEEQFYLVFPVVLLVGWRLRSRHGAAMGRSGGAIAVAAVSIVSFVVSLGLSGTRSSGGFNTLERVAFYGSPTRAWEFGAGALVALAVVSGRRLDPLRTWLLALTGAIGIAAAATLVHDTAAVPGKVALLPVLGAGALLFAGAGPATRLSRLLGSGPAVWIGDLSYSWYLWHWPVIVFATALWPRGSEIGVVAAAVSLLPAWFSYRFVENPIRFGRRSGRVRIVALALVCILLPLAAVGGSLAARRALADTSALKSWARSQEPHAGEARGCDSPIPLPERHIQNCTWPAPAARGSVVLVGDSNASHFVEPVVAAARRAGLTTIVATYPSCPFTTAHIVGTRVREASCRRFDTGTLTELLRLEPNLVIVASRTDKYVEDANVAIRRPDGSATVVAAEKARLWAVFLRRALVRLNDAGIPALVVHPVPSFPPATDRCDAIRVLTSSCAASVSRRQVDQALSRSIEAEDAAVRGLPTSWAVSMEDELCDRRRCTAEQNGVTIYRNHDHLSVDGASLLTGSFFRAISQYTRP